VNNEYLERAKKIITDPKVLCIVASKRANQIARGARPMIKCDSDNHLDVALLEIAENKLSYEYGTENAATAATEPVDVISAIQNKA
jgi:DNA-directed RNA polymerase subunit K/omega